MELSRRDFLKGSSAIAAAFGLQSLGVFCGSDAEALETDNGGVPVIWLQAQACTGCSVSLLNSIYYTTIDNLLLNTLDLNYHPQLSAAAGNLAVAQVEKTYRQGGYVLVVEGAIPTANGGSFCYLWPGLTALDAVTRYTKNAAFILAVGSCASFGGMAAGAPNPTGAKGLDDAYSGKRVIRIPGCPVHPDWVVGTIAYLIKNGSAPALDSYGRPLDYFSSTVHSKCPYREMEEVSVLGRTGCLKELGCKGPKTRADCPNRKWNAGGAGQPGVNWCIGAGAPCYGCTEPAFPDGMSPFYSHESD